MSRYSTVVELLRFLKSRKKAWLTPVVLALVVLGILFVFAESSVLAPFIYALF